MVSFLFRSCAVSITAQIVHPRTRRCICQPVRPGTMPMVSRGPGQMTRLGATRTGSPPFRSGRFSGCVRILAPGSPSPPSAFAQRLKSSLRHPPRTPSAFRSGRFSGCVRILAPGLPLTTQRIRATTEVVTTTPAPGPLSFRSGRFSGCVRIITPGSPSPPNAFAQRLK